MGSINPGTSRWSWSVGAALILAALAALGLATPQESVTVKRVIDGDTMVLESGERLQLIGVDTPHTVHPRKQVEKVGKEASAFTRRMVQGKRVRVEYDPVNASRNRKESASQEGTLAYVFLEDGTLLNWEIIRLGYGFNNVPSSKNT